MSEPESDRPQAVGAAAPLEPERQIFLEDYQPSAKNLRRCLWTRKEPSDSYLPGLLRTYGNDGWWFAAAIGLEIWGLWNLYAALQFNPVFAVLLFFLDLLGAGLAHACARRTCIQRNLRLVSTPPPNSREDLAIKSYIKTGHYVIRTIGVVMVIALAGIKLAGLADSVEKFNGPVFISLIASYLGAMVIHLFSSGYVIFDLWRKLLWAREHGKFSAALRDGDHNQSGWPAPHNREFLCRAALQAGKFGQKDRHELVSLGGERYEIRTFGVLEDKDVVEICMNQRDNFGSEVLKKQLIALQMQNLLEMPDPARPQLYK